MDSSVWPQQPILWKILQLHFSGRINPPLLVILFRKANETCQKSTRFGSCNQNQTEPPFPTAGRGCVCTQPTKTLLQLQNKTWHVKEYCKQVHSNCNIMYYLTCKQTEPKGSLEAGFDARPNLRQLTHPPQYFISCKFRLIHKSLRDLMGAFSDLSLMRTMVSVHPKMSLVTCCKIGEIMGRRGQKCILTSCIEEFIIGAFHWVFENILHVPLGTTEAARASWKYRESH